MRILKREWMIVPVLAVLAVIVVFAWLTVSNKSVVGVAESVQPVEETIVSQGTSHGLSGLSWQGKTEVKFPIRHWLWIVLGVIILLVGSACFPVGTHPGSINRFTSYGGAWLLLAIFLTCLGAYCIIDIEEIFDFSYLELDSVGPVSKPELTETGRQYHPSSEGIVYGTTGLIWEGTTSNRSGEVLLTVADACDCRCGHNAWSVEGSEP